MRGYIMTIPSKILIAALMLATLSPFSLGAMNEADNATPCEYELPSLVCLASKSIVDYIKSSGDLTDYNRALQDAKELIASYFFDLSSSEKLVDTLEALSNSNKFEQGI